MAVQAFADPAGLEGVVAQPVIEIRARNRTALIGFAHIGLYLLKLGLLVGLLHFFARLASDEEGNQPGYELRDHFAARALAAIWARTPCTASLWAAA